MKVLKNSMRYEILEKQFHFDRKLNSEIMKSNKRFFTYIYEQTDLFYLEDIHDSTLYNYIKVNLSASKPKISLSTLIKDIKNFLFYLEKVSSMVETPKVDLSLTNIRLWKEIGNYNRK